jgi:hypothetical protein
MVQNLLKIQQKFSKKIQQNKILKHLNEIEASSWYYWKALDEWHFL